jgi:hypothetical protein
MQQRRRRPCSEVSLLDLQTYLNNDEIMVSVSDGSLPITVLLGLESSAAELNPMECRRLATALLNAAELVESVTA